MPKFQSANHRCSKAQMQEDNKENVNVYKKKLVGTRNTQSPLVSFSNSITNSTVIKSEKGSPSSSFDKLLKLMVTPSTDSCTTERRNCARNSQIEASSNVNPTNTEANEALVIKSDEGSPNSSFDKLLKLMVTPSADSCTTERRNSQIKASSRNVNPTSTETNEAPVRNSFKVMLNSLLTPLHPSIQTTEETPEKTFKELLNKMVTRREGNSQIKVSLRNVNSTNIETNEAPVRKSFEVMLNSLLTPPHPFIQTTEETPEETFEELLNKMVTPHLTPPRIQMKQKEQPSSQSTKQLTKQHKRQIADFTKTAQADNPNEEISFDQLLTQMSKESSPSTQIHSSQSTVEITQQPKRQVANFTSAQARTSFDLLLTQRSNPESQKSEKDSSPDTQMQQKVQSTVKSTKDRKKQIADSAETSTQTDNPNDEMSFDQLLTQMPNPGLQEWQSESTEKNNCKEISTQTSFDELMLTQNTLSNVSTSCAQLNHLPFLYSQNFDSDVNGNVDIADPCDEPLSISDIYPKSVKHALNGSLPDPSSEPGTVPDNPKPVKHILDVLSHDITILPDGRRIFNISKIGTDKWLKSALLISNKNIKVSKADRIEVEETQNTFNMFTDNSTKLNLKRSHRGTTKICKIRKVQMSGSSESFNDTFQDVSSSQFQLRSTIDKICQQEELICSDYNPQLVDKAKIRVKIHDVFAKLYDVYQNRQVPRLVLRRRSDRRGCVYKNGRLQYGALKDAPLKRMNSDVKRNRQTFCRLLYVMGKIYSMLQNDTKLTQREIFYQVKLQVKNQSWIRTSIEEVSCLLGLGYWHLNIICHSGLVYGNLKLFWASGEVTNCNTPATLIPYGLEDMVEVQSNASFILVVEKESIYHKLLEEDLPNKLARPFIMITGKGVPNINTRLFLNRLSRMLSLPVFILVDADVAGISIMLNYRFGTIPTCHLSDDLAVPNARWLGVFPSEISKYGMEHQELSKRDKSIINGVLKNPCMESNPKIVREVELLLKSNKKASIEGLIKNNTFLSESYLPVKFFNKDFL